MITARAAVKPRGDTRAAIRVLEDARFYSVNSYRISDLEHFILFKGSKHRFESYLNIVLILGPLGYTVENHDQYGSINADRLRIDDDFSRNINTIVFERLKHKPIIQISHESRGNHLTLDNYPAYLGSSKFKVNLQNSRDPVKIGIIDTGFYKHPDLIDFWNRRFGTDLDVQVKLKNPEPANLFQKRKLVALKNFFTQLQFDLDTKYEVDEFKDSLIEGVDEDIQEDYRSANHSFGQKRADLTNQRTPPFDPREIAFYTKPSQFIDEIDARLTEIDNRMELIRKYSRRDMDFDGHGTMVIANLLPLVPRNAQIFCYKHFEYENISELIEMAIEDGMHIISISAGAAFNPDELTQNQIDSHLSSDPVIQAMREAEIQQIAVLNAIGNWGEGHPRGALQINDPDPNRSIESYVREIIIVGGAYKALSDNISKDYQWTTYSNSSYGYPDPRDNTGSTYLPHVCGWNGSKSRDYEIYLPYMVDNGNAITEHGLALAQGTSFSTPQIAAVCALIKNKWPQIPPDQMRKILMEKSEVCHHGVSAQGISMAEKANGLIRINNALSMASKESKKSENILVY